ncbi:hypothetical protein EAG_09763 [Camponotus floridanus]|nr:hypothetical protein EAG_09763 [Camponotus floridanus]
MKRHRRAQRRRVTTSPQDLSSTNLALRAPTEYEKRNMPPFLADTSCRLSFQASQVTYDSSMYNACMRFAPVEGEAGKHEL